MVGGFAVFSAIGAAGLSLRLSGGGLGGRRTAFARVSLSPS